MQIIFDAGDMSVDAPKELVDMVEPSWIDYDKLKGSCVLFSILRSV